MLDLLALCAGAAVDRGDLDVARMLQARGQRGAALSVLRRVAELLGPLGLEVPVALLAEETAA